MRHHSLQIISHRACLHGPEKTQENRLSALLRAVDHGFDVEFDINFNAARTKLVLSHDPAEWSEAYDALSFLTQASGDSFHALNVKSLYTVPAICRALLCAGTQAHFFLFDFELVTDDLAGCRFLMRSLGDDGFSVAYRLSERETFLEQYLRQPHVSLVWLDEFTLPWVRRDHVAALADAGKQIFYVSPDLHGKRDLDVLKPRWEQLVSWGATGICTDYPIQLDQFLGKTLGENR